jgi:hypothetical protein
MWNPLPLSPSFYPLHRPPPTHSPLSLSHPTASSRCRPTSLAAPLAPASPVLADRRASQQRTYGGTGTTHKQAADLPSRRRIREHRGVGRSSLVCWATKVAGGGRSSCTAADLGQGTAGLGPSLAGPLLWLRARSRGGSPRGRARGPLAAAARSCRAPSSARGAVAVEKPSALIMSLPLDRRHGGGASASSAQKLPENSRGPKNAQVREMRGLECLVLDSKGEN